MSVVKHALESLGFTTADEQLAFMGILDVSGYLSASNIEQALRALGVVQSFAGVTVGSMIGHMTEVIDAGRKEPDVARYIIDNLFVGPKFAGLETSDVVDILVYLAQYAFARKKNQERCDLDPRQWMEDTGKVAAFGAMADKLGMVNEIKLPRKEYDVCFILGGAVEPRMKPRIQSLSRHLNKINIKGETKVLAGDRLLSSPLDGDVVFSEFFPDGYKLLSAEDYLHKYREDINDLGDGDSLERRIISGRKYLDLPPAELVKYTEYFAGSYYLDEQGSGSIKTMNTATGLNELRPTTKSTAQDAIKKLIQEGAVQDDSKLRIAVLTNNPYVRRQTCDIECVVRTELQKRGLNNVRVIVDGCGDAATELTAVMSSAFGALVFSFVKAHKANKRPLQCLGFQSRDKYIAQAKRDSASQANSLFVRVELPELLCKGGCVHKIGSLVS